jgi:hypothetical protein
MQATWERAGSDYVLILANQSWRLGLGGTRPGLAGPDQWTTGGALLALDGLAATGRSDPTAFRAENLVSVELFRSRVEATYAPAGWADLKVRASWSPTRDGKGVDLEVQVTALSVGELRAVEVFVSSFVGPGDSAGALTIEVLPRDRRAAGLSYDGRESAEVLHRLRTAPVPDGAANGISPVALGWSHDDHFTSFLEMVHPDDAARRMIIRRIASGQPEGDVVAIRNGLFGYDLERGVVLRGRLRGLWVTEPAEQLAGKAGSEFRRFLDEPPPLGM